MQALHNKTLARAKHSPKLWPMTPPQGLPHPALRAAPLPREAAPPALAGLRSLLAPVGVGLALLGQPSPAGAAQYYVDAQAGSDGNSGQSAATAWQSLERVNTANFLPDDEILLKAGSSWTGHLSPHGSGAAGHPIRIGRYGTGERPRIDGGGLTGTAVVYLQNQQYWEIADLDITNPAKDAGDRRGVLVSASQPGVWEHIWLLRLSIHDIKGIVGQSIEAKRTAGIGIEATGKEASRFDDVRIEGCSISTVDNTGLYTSASEKAYPGTDAWKKRCFTHVLIRGNVIHHIAKNAMIVRFLQGGIVERNLCYETALKLTGNTMFTSSCDGTIFQYNEGCFNRSPDYDGSMYDADLESPNTVWQYSYSHDNAHGLFWTCTVQDDANVVCRYNVSRNDKGVIFCINYPNTSVFCYNNTVYCGPDTSPTIISERHRGGPGPRTYYFFNNVIYNESSRTRYEFHAEGYRRVIDHNVFYGQHPMSEPDDEHKITADPLFVSLQVPPGSPGQGLDAVMGLRLRASSPCIGSALTGYADGGLDYAGTALPPGGRRDRGAFFYRAQ